MSKRLWLVGIIVTCALTTVWAQPKGHPALTACKPDIARFCGNVPPGGGRIKECMKAHLPELSEPCKEALFQAWLHQ